MCSTSRRALGRLCGFQVLWKSFVPWLVFGSHCVPRSVGEHTALCAPCQLSGGAVSSMWALCLSSQPSSSAPSRGWAYVFSWTNNQAQISSSLCFLCVKDGSQLLSCLVLQKAMCRVELPAPDPPGLTPPVLWKGSWTGSCSLLLATGLC